MRFQFILILIGTIKYDGFGIVLIDTKNKKSDAFAYGEFVIYY